jgi:DNA invertase Pin-like site-specific DNA recombinase
VDRAESQLEVIFTAFYMRHENRPQLLAALASAKKLGATLLIPKLDGLARNVHLISDLMETGVDFIAADLPQANRLTVHIMAAMAEHEREMISERTQAGMDAARREITLNGFRISKTGRKFSTFGNPRWQESIDKARAAKLPLPAPLPAQLILMMREKRNQAASLRARRVRRSPSNRPEHCSSFGTVFE